MSVEKLCFLVMLMVVVGILVIRYIRYKDDRASDTEASHEPHS